MFLGDNSINLQFRNLVKSALKALYVLFNYIFSGSELRNQAVQLFCTMP